MRQSVDISPYIEAFEAARRTLPGAVHTDDLRTGAIERFKALGLPHNKQEDWKYTDLRPFQRQIYAPWSDVARTDDSAPHGDAALSGLVIEGLGGPRLVFRNGRFEAGGDTGPLPDGVAITSLRTALEDGDDGLAERLSRVSEADPLAQLNTAMMADGAVIRIARDASLAAPIEIVHRCDRANGRAVHLRHVIILEDGASAGVVETYGGDDSTYWTNAVTQIDLGTGARLDHAVRQVEGEKAVHTGKVVVHVGGGARYRNTALNTGGEATRRDYRLTLGDEAAEAHLGGVQLARSGQVMDTATLVDHAAPHCTSNQPYRAVVGARGRTAFEGKVLVRQDAQKSDARQSSNNLLLDRAAEADTKPELEIYADDVQCAHGATVGELDETAQFYLTARGIPPREARALLIRAFIDERLVDIDNETIRNAFLQTAHDWIARDVGRDEPGRDEH